MHVELADMLKDKLPNTSSFNHNQTWNTRCDANISKAMLAKYQTQLAYLEYSGPALDIGLESPDLAILSYFGVFQGDADNRLRIAYPEPLRKLKAKSRVLGLAASFTALKEMQLANVASSGFNMFYSLEGMERRCPQLQRIRLNDVALARDGRSWRQASTAPRVME